MSVLIKYSPAFAPLYYSISKSVTKMTKCLSASGRDRAKKGDQRWKTTTKMIESDNNIVDLQNHQSFLLVSHTIASLALCCLIISIMKKTIEFGMAKALCFGANTQVFKKI